jgi:hypothetical protein
MIVLGADTHKRSHTIAAVSAATGELLGEQTVQAGAKRSAALAADQRDEVAGVDRGQHLIDPPVLPAGGDQQLGPRLAGDHHSRGAGALPGGRVPVSGLREPQERAVDRPEGVSRRRAAARVGGWAAGERDLLPRRDPRARKSLPRFIDEYVMGQLETAQSLDGLPDLTTQTAVVILIETGLRSIDCLRLPYDPITTMRQARRISCSSITSSREAIIPITDRLVAQIRHQQQDLAERFAKPPSILLPQVRANPDGEIPFSCGKDHHQPGLSRRCSGC